ncbi:response regulator [Thalassoroseus pseudoceratinae]|uniref:response regulator n=1 Tax=Thalassoroseus pseudoceratinae TaxID=2713176 RepID=UPI00141DFE00|nr:response regulator [Thalassoroseus pseudoceratinae]
MTKRLKIVIADDEEDIRQGFRRLLCRLGCDVIGEASNGCELVKLCQNNQPDLVITDIRMPMMSGLEAARKIAETQSIPVIVVSSYDCPADEDCNSVADFLLKPVGLPDLEAAIAKACPPV